MNCFRLIGPHQCNILTYLHGHQQARGHTHTTHGAEHFLINERYKNEEMESCKKQCLSAC